ncbi:MAG TPA: type 1 glutamine amidotransferase domain-containing protein [Gemmatimonadaceae bacterium]|nr:type 1 glutamine amidotransferase domain-containing protein [Gemmatimonadaceae bacterium]
MSRGTIVILVGPDYEDLEVWYPKLRLEEAGYATPLVGMGETSYSGKHGYPCTVDAHVADFTADAVAGIVAPGGWAPDKLRRDRNVLRLVRQLHEEGKMVASICHGPWILISAGLVRGRRITGSQGIRDDVVNAGATWVDEPAVVDGNIVTARLPKDLPAFAAAMLSVLEPEGAASGGRVGHPSRLGADPIIAHP